MLGWTQKFISITVIIILFAFYLLPFKAKAASSCSVTLSPSNVSATTNSSFDISITNNGSSDINWVDINVPTNNFFYTGNNVYTWTSADHSGGTTLSGNTISPGSTEIFSVSAIADLVTGDGGNWQIKADESGGSDPSICTGDTSTFISSGLTNDYSVGVSNIQIIDITSRQATITWDTDYPTTSIVFYGKTSGYGHNSNYDLNTTTNHSVTLSNLEATTGYHFQVAGSDRQGTFAFSTDNTFITEKSQNGDNGGNGNGGGNNNSGNNGVLGSGIPILAKPIEKIAPSISLSKPSSKVFKQPPVFNGQASDNVSIARVQYSVDGGVNWLPTDTATGLGSRQSSFTFTPFNLDDGTYTVLARAIDTSGNIGISDSVTIVIAKIPPMVGGNLVSVGPQILLPSPNGIVTSLVGVDQKITMSSVGGPTNVYLTATLKGSKQNRSKLFNLTKSQDSGLWSGIISFDEPGLYEMTATAVNGAGTKNTRKLNNVSVLKPGRIIDQKTLKPVASTVKVYTFENESKKWVVWNGETFSQENPQRTSEGNVSYFLPPGKYYLEVKSKGYQTLVSRIFNVSTPMPFTQNLSLKPLTTLNFGIFHLTIVNLSAKYVSVETSYKLSEANQTSFINHSSPTFGMPTTNGSTLHTADLLGKPTVLTFGSTWSPAMVEQLGVLNKLQKNSDINTVPIALQEDAAKVKAYNSISGINLNWAVDQDGVTTESYKIVNLPTHFFLDRKGVIRDVYSGVLNENQVLSRLGGL